MRILVTGASGLLGLNLALEASADHQVFGQVHSNRLHTSKFSVIEGDLLAPDTVQRLLDETQPNWVIHCAALANLDACEADPAQAIQLNTEIPAKLAELVSKGGARLLHVSTDAVFDGKRGGYYEEDLPNPLGVYAQTKLAGERAVAEANPEAIIARVNLFGFSLKGRRSLSEFFLYNLQEGRQVMGFTDVYFCPLLVNDLAHIFLKMLSVELSGLYHAVSSECITKYDFGLRLARRFGLDQALIKPVSVSDAGLSAARSPNLTLNSEKLARSLGETMPGITSGLEHFYNLYQSGYPRFIREMGIAG